MKKILNYLVLFGCITMFIQCAPKAFIYTKDDGTSTTYGKNYTKITDPDKIQDNDVKNNVQVTVFTLNLEDPTNRSLQITSGYLNQRLVLKSKSPISFRVINANPLKYKYVINHEYVDFFKDANYDPADSVSAFIALQNGRHSIMDTIAAQDSIHGATYNIKAIRSYNLIWDEPAIANELGIRRLDPYDTQSDFKNVENALKIVGKKAENLHKTLANGIAQFGSEEFLNKQDIAQLRNYSNEQNIQILAYIRLIDSDVQDFNDSAFTAKYDILKQTLKFDLDFIKESITRLFSLQFEYRLEPQDINGKNIDVVKINVKKYPLTGDPTPIITPYNIWISGGLKLDVSAGIYMTSLNDYEYSTEDVTIQQGTTTVTQQKIYLNNKNQLDFGVGGMLNISPRGGTWVKPALNIGTLITTSQKLQILAGGGVIFGKEERVIFHGGLALGFRNKIESRYKIDGQESYDLGANKNVPTTNSFGTGYFFGITYNFNKIKAAIPEKKNTKDEVAE
ncbi:hypothetical protein [Flavobacterium sp. ENC]|uniref:hypothetical protein n=1 Tax=Flavobacterium sp. ENC TaxID=2897330 RepID=UPI001E30F189|nr:hypothetical protein [Flavobacterium sp. ENC]MCD0467244.1 hypothetical protein [Flavobacterium sp. ENC]